MEPVVTIGSHFVFPITIELLRLFAKYWFIFYIVFRHRHTGYCWDRCSLKTDFWSFDTAFAADWWVWRKWVEGISRRRERRCASDVCGWWASCLTVLSSSGLTSSRRVVPNKIAKLCTLTGKWWAFTEEPRALWYFLHHLLSPGWRIAASSTRLTSRGNR